MKNVSYETLNTNIQVEKISVGRVYPGQVFLYKGRFWFVVNPLPEIKGKFVARKFNGHENDYLTLPNETAVKVIRYQSINESKASRMTRSILQIFFVVKKYISLLLSR